MAITISHNIQRTRARATQVTATATAVLCRTAQHIRIYAWASTLTVYDCAFAMSLLYFVCDWSFFSTLLSSRAHSVQALFNYVSLCSDLFSLTFISFSHWFIKCSLYRGHFDKFFFFQLEFLLRLRSGSGSFTFFLTTATNITGYACAVTSVYCWPGQLMLCDSQWGCRSFSIRLAFRKHLKMCVVHYAHDNKTEGG